MMGTEKQIENEERRVCPKEREHGTRQAACPPLQKQTCPPSSHEKSERFVRAYVQYATLEV